MAEPQQLTEQEQEIFEFLDDLRDSNTANMFGAGADIRATYGTSKQESRVILSKWMEQTD